MSEPSSEKPKPRAPKPSKIVPKLSGAIEGRLGVSTKVARWIAIGFAATMIGVFAAGAGAIFIFYHFSAGLPDYHQLATYDPPVMTRVYAGDGRLVQEYAVESRVFVPIEAIPKRVSEAFIASEDQRFYTHPGVDPIGLFRAVVEALGEKLSGSDKRLKGASIPLVT